MTSLDALPYSQFLFYNALDLTSSAFLPYSLVPPIATIQFQRSQVANSDNSDRNRQGRSYNPGRPLSMNDRERILQLYEKGHKISHIARIIGVTHSCVSKIMTSLICDPAKCAENDNIMEPPFESIAEETVEMYHLNHIHQKTENKSRRKLEFKKLYRRTGSMCPRSISAGVLTSRRSSAELSESSSECAAHSAFEEWSAAYLKLENLSQQEIREVNSANSWNPQKRIEDENSNVITKDEKGSVGVTSTTRAKVLSYSIERLLA